MTVDNEYFVEEALRIVRAADEEGIQLRILGSLAYRLHCPAYIDLFDKMKRDLTDIDVAARRGQARQIRDFMADLGYRIDEQVSIATEGSRYCFQHPEAPLGIDVFMGELYFCHPIPLEERLDLDSPTIPLADLVLEKMQIVEINLKDIKDTMVLFLEHDVSNEYVGTDTIDGSYIAGLLSRDWGFYHTVTQNLDKLTHFYPQFEAVGKDQIETIDRRVRRLREMIEQTPKSARWKMRSKIGTRVRWYQQVNEKTSTF